MMSFIVVADLFYEKHWYHKEKINFDADSS